jgi:uncharacterized protein (TIGR02996 family)
VTDRDFLLARVLGEPADDTIRFVLADLLRESGDIADRALGRFLWAGITAAQFRQHETIDDPIYYSAHSEIEAIAVEGHPYRWLAKLGIGSTPIPNTEWLWDCTLDRVTVRCGKQVGVFTRGLLAEVTVASGEWLAIAPAALSTWPLELVNVADIPGLSFAIGRTGSGWRCIGRLTVPRRRVPLGGGVIPSAYAPIPFLTEERAAWLVEEGFPDRQVMVATIGPTSARLAAELREVAGDRWPQLPRQRTG